MATTPTNLPVPSESALDLKFNAGKIDEFVTSFALKYKDRLGGDHYTIEGLRQLAQQAIAAFGWVLMDSFQAGATLTLPNQVLRWKLPDGDGDYYRWDGELPKVVPENSTPESTGGIGAGKWLSVGDAVLRTELSEFDGSTLVGGSSYVVDSFDDALHASAGNSKVIITRGHTTVGIGSATYIRNDSTGTPSTGNELSFYDASGRGWTLRTDGVIDCRQFGIKGDGTNETVKVQLWLDCCAEVGAEAYIPDGLTVSIVGVVIDRNHDGLKFNCAGWFKLFGDGSIPANIPSNTGSNSYFGIYINGASNINGKIQVDGDRGSKIYNEQIHCIGMFGGVDNNICLKFKECRGDGIYVNHYFGNSISEPPVNSDPAKNFPTRLTLNVESKNTDYDGRNAISLIAYKQCTVSGVSYKHGNGNDSGVSSIGKQPGGLDVEPNYYWQSCYDLVVTSWIADSAGASGGFSLVGKANGNEPEDVNIRGVIANAEVTTALTNDTVRYGFPIQYARDLNIKAISRCLTNNTFTTYKCCGFMMTCITNFNIEIEVMRTERVGEISCEDSINQKLVRSQNGKLTIHATHCHNGISIGDISGVDIDFNINTPVLMSGTGDRGVVQYIKSFYDGGYQASSIQNHNLKVNCSGGVQSLSQLNFGIRVHPIYTPTVIQDSCRIDNSNLGWIAHSPSDNKNRMLGTANFQKGFINGVTYLSGDTAITGTNIWGVGDIIWSRSPSAAYAGNRFNGTSWKYFGPLS